jgi:hypothetical protein
LTVSYGYPRLETALRITRRIWLIWALVVVMDAQSIDARADGSATPILLIPDNNGDFFGKNIDHHLHEISVQTACDTFAKGADLATQSARIYAADVSFLIKFIQLDPEDNALGAYINKVPADLAWSNNSLALTFRFDGSEVQQYTLDGDTFNDSNNSFNISVVYKDVLNFRYLQILVPLQDTTEPVLRIDLTSPGFQAYSENCYNQLLKKEQDVGDSDVLDGSNAPPQIPPAPTAQNSQPQAASQPSTPAISCLLPNGSTIQTQSSDDCRSQNGLINSQ